jgi:hypothetical protein
MTFAREIRFSDCRPFQRTVTESEESSALAEYLTNQSNPSRSEFLRGGLPFTEFISIHKN